MRVKMCGMKTLAAARAAEEAGADYVGFIFAEGSRRYVAPAARRVIKAYRYGDDFEAAAANAYPAEIILVDSYVAGAAGGTGTAFGWQEAAREIARVTKPVLIAGGITAENVGEAAAVFHSFGVDVSGGLEENGEKSEAKIRAFMAAVRACD